MKALKYLIYSVVLTASMSTALVACGKKSDDTSNLTVGSLVSDGNSITSSSTVGGYALSLSINNFTSYNTGCTYQYGVQQCTPQTNFVVSANSQQTQLSVRPRNIQTSTQDQRAQSNLGNFQMLYQSACYDATCANIATEIIIGTGYEYKQIVFKRDMSSNKITNMSDTTINNQTVRPLYVIMQTL